MHSTIIVKVALLQTAHIQLPGFVTSPWNMLLHPHYSSVATTANLTLRILEINLTATLTRDHLSAHLQQVLMTKVPSVATAADLALHISKTTTMGTLNRNHLPAHLAQQSLMTTVLFWPTNFWTICLHLSKRFELMAHWTISGPCIQKQLVVCRPRSIPHRAMSSHRSTVCIFCNLPSPFVQLLESKSHVLHLIETPELPRHVAAK